MPRSTAVPLHRQRTLLAQERRTDPGLDAFIHALDRYPNLTPAEARHLALRAQEGDTAARDRLVECHLRLVVSVAKGYIGRGVPLMDLIQEGSIGLLTAIEKYDPDKSRFITLATWWIWDSVSKAVLAQSTTIRIPNHVQIQAARVRAAEAAAEASGDTLSAQELSDRAGVSPEHLERVRAARQMARPLSLDYETSSGRLFAETLRDHSYSHSLYEQAVESERIETLYRHLRTCLTHTEREIVYLRFGLQHAYREHSFEEIAVELGMSRRQVKRECERALEKLRAAYGVDELLATA